MSEVRRRTVVVGYDGSPASERAVVEATPILAVGRVLVVTVWEPGMAFTLVDPGLVPAPIDIRAALEVDKAMYERARHLAEQGAHLARKAGVEAEGLAVADELSVADTLLRIVRERKASAVVVGSHGHRGVRELLLGSTTRDLIRDAGCPVVVVRTADRTDG
jgi:nucleotide-binding universal stress UspA family protein